ncbi:MAG: hypothetical protein JNL67_06795 [Planctomycetaceae bacterium]|nr:hypothetical protein [Planctomycetaceae bacterium]
MATAATPERQIASLAAGSIWTAPAQDRYRLTAAFLVVFAAVTAFDFGLGGGLLALGVLVVVALVMVALVVDLAAFGAAPALAIGLAVV